MISNHLLLQIIGGDPGRKILGGQVLNILGPPGGAKGCHTPDVSNTIGWGIGIGWYWGVLKILLLVLVLLRVFQNIGIGIGYC